MSVAEKINLIMTEVEILKLKANDYVWQCETPMNIRDELDATLVEIDELLKRAKGEL